MKNILLTTFVPMRKTLGCVLLMAAVLSLISVVGCSPQYAPVVLPSESSATPVFVSEDEALAAAEQAFAAFVSMMNKIRADGGADPERVQQVATLEVYENERPGLQRMAESGEFTNGAASFDTMTIKEFDPTNLSAEIVVTNVCEDFSEVELLDRNGNNTLSPDRQVRWPLVVGFQYNEHRFLVSSIEVWDGQDFCD